jgi:hypothetical protein
MTPLKGILRKNFTQKSTLFFISFTEISPYFEAEKVQIWYEHAAPWVTFGP